MGMAGGGGYLMLDEKVQGRGRKAQGRLEPSSLRSQPVESLKVERLE